MCSHPGRTRPGAWASAIEPLSAVVALRPELARWYDAASARGMVKRACGTPAEAAPVVSAAARLLGLLPLAGTPLAQVANDVAGDAHALDHGRPLATIVASAIRHTWWTAGCGLRIANLLWSRYLMRPWRFDTPSYVASASPRSAPVRGQPVDAA